nr:UDP-N-acetylmuramate dehydrogenase [Thioalkalivibrio sulfidiphilus]
MMTAENLQMLRGELRHHEPLARYTSWRVGGTADQLYKPADLDDLAFFLSTLPPKEPLLWLGLGSNLLVRDGGVRGTVIALSGALNEMTLLPDNRIRAEAGVACAKLARFAADANLTGCEFLAGIPGTLGGALAMNAGAWGGETWTCVETVETLDRRGRRHLREADEYQVAYRSVITPVEEWFTAATFRLTPGDGQAGKARIRELLAERAERQPTGVASCGSVFRNPPGDHAGRLVEAAGLKGHRIGGAQVSEKHANFIINTGDATAADLEALIRHVQATVEARFGVRLEPEVRVVGEPLEGRA